MTQAALKLTRSQILAFRRRTGALDERLPAGSPSLARAAFAGLQDSMPRAAALSLHARVEGVKPNAWEDPVLAQIWGPRYNVFVIPAGDLAVFTLGWLPDDARGRRRAEETAARLHSFLAGKRMSYESAGRELGVHPNSLRYASPTGTVLIRWEGARRPIVWTAPAPELDPREARLELARRYLHVYGPATADAFGWWSSIGTRFAAAAFEAIGDAVIRVRTPIVDAWMLTSDEPTIRDTAGTTAAARLLPSGDPYFLFQGSDRELMVPDAALRSQLWTPRVWPGALLVDGEIAGTWRRAGETVTISPWTPLSAQAHEAVEREASGLPLGLTTAIKIHWQA